MCAVERTHISTTTTPSEASPDFLRVKAIAQRTGLSRARIYHSIDRGELEALRLGGCTLIPYQSYLRWIETALPVEPRA